MPQRGNDRRRRGGRSGGGGGGYSAWPKRAHEQTDIDESSPVIQAFRGYQTELDMRHDKYERLVKLSRDITIESKRAIFLLQRISVTEATKTLNDAEFKFAEIRATRWRAVAEELQNEDPNQFIRAYSAGLQEYVEAVSFWYYLQNNALISWQQIHDGLIFRKEPPADSDKEEPKDEPMPSSSTPPAEGATTDTVSPPGGDVIAVNVPPIEYMLGIADLTGELMRNAISAVGKGQLDTPAKTCNFMRIIYDAFLSYGNVSRELSRKMVTLKQSLAKVENACYMLQVRGSEVPKHMLVDVICAASTDNYAECDDE